MTATMIAQDLSLLSSSSFITQASEALLAREAILSEGGALILVDKPYAETSFHVVNQIRKAMSRVLERRVKCGHAGTLDPLATGLLIVATRRKTKSLAQLVALDKIYFLRLRFGVTSPSFDLERPVEIVSGLEQLTEHQVHEAIV